MQQTIQQDDPALVAEHGQREMQRVLQRAAVDRAFRTRLLTEPRVALAEFNGRDAVSEPFPMNIVFVENRATATVVLPDFVDPAAELSADELETVAGGITPSILIVTLLTAGGAVSYGAYTLGHSQGDCR